MTSQVRKSVSSRSPRATPPALHHFTARSSRHGQLMYPVDGAGFSTRSQSKHSPGHSLISFYFRLNLGLNLRVNLRTLRRLISTLNYGHMACRTAFTRAGTNLFRVLLVQMYTRTADCTLPEHK